MDHPATGPNLQARGGRILLVEDHADTVELMNCLLKGQGYSVASADSVAAGLRLARAESFDLLISDLGLPDGSGLDLIRQLQADGKAIKAIVLSGFAMEEDIRRSKEAGFLEHLIKPVNLQVLKETIRRLLGW